MSSQLVLMYENQYCNDSLISSRPVVIDTLGLHLYPTQEPLNLNPMYPEDKFLYTDKPLTRVNMYNIDPEELQDLIDMGFQCEP